ncbi:MAG: YjdF family protein [Eubacteriales bacterium]|nr:YjdF family protein [Eubacteriales bacterium]
MDQVRARLTVLFEEPFWIGLYEREANGRYEACRIVFGAEPKDYTVYQLLLERWNELHFSPGVEAVPSEERRKNPKRLQREARQATRSTGVGTMAQQALKLQQEQGKLERKDRSKRRREAEEQRQFDLRQEKRKEKHRGH